MENDDDDFTDWLIAREECIEMELDDEELKATRKLNGADKLTTDEMFKNLGYMIDEDENRVIFDNREINIIFDKETRTINTDESITFNMQELKAINKKCKELGWIDE